MAAKRAPSTSAKPALKAATKTPTRGKAALPAPAKASKDEAASKATAKAAPAPGKKAAAAAPPPPPAKAATVGTKQLAIKLAEKHQLPRKQAEAVMQDVVGYLVEHLKAGDKLRLAGLGTIQVRHRAARAGRNPATGEAIQIAASKKIAFTPAKELKGAV